MKDKKFEKQPHAKQRRAYHLSQRCGAKRKYDGQPCQAPAANGKGRCRMHGGASGSGAPRKNNNALKHGAYTHNQKTIHTFLRNGASKLSTIEL